jgi:hypothetical protein
LQRFTAAGVTNQATIASIVPYIQMTFNNGAAINITLRIGWPQLEQGAFATSPIPTTSAAVTRAADIVTLTSPPAFGSAYTLFASGVPQAPANYTANQTIISATDGTIANRFEIGRLNGTGGAHWILTLAGTQQWNAGGGTFMPTGVLSKTAASTSANNQNGCLNGGAVQTQASGTPPTGATITSVPIGFESGVPTAFFNGLIQHLGIWLNTALTAVQLQTLTQAPSQFLPYGPQLDLDFADGLYWGTPVGQTPSQFLTTTRASPGTAVNSGGVYTQFAAGIPRITDLGLLVEEARTNSVPNSTCQGAAIPNVFPTGWTGAALGVVNGVTWAIAGVGTENGINYIDYSMVGTPTGSAQNNIAFTGAFGTVAATNGQTWTCSFFTRLVSGSTANLQLVNQAVWSAAGGGFLGNTTTSLISILNSGLSLGNSRSINVSPITNASTAFVGAVYTINYTSGLPVNAVLRIGWPQLELGTWATSPILTTNAAVTRAGDLVSMPQIFGAAYSYYCAFTPQGPVTTTNNQFALTVCDGTTTNRSSALRLGASGAAGLVNTATGGAGNFVFNNAALNATPTLQQNALVKCANANTGASGMTTIAIGFRPSPNNDFQLGGYIPRVTVWPVALTNAQLQTLTAPPSWVLPYGPTIDMDFADGLYFGSGPPSSALTVSSSGGTAINAAGNWIQFGANTPRITNLGLLVEESRTNAVRNNTMQGAVVGVPGTLPINWSFNNSGTGLSTAVVNIGTVNGINFIDVQVSGTATAGNAFLSIDSSTVAASPGQVWANSVFAALQGGSFTNVTAFFLVSNFVPSGNLALGLTPLLTATLTRYTASNTAPAGTTGISPLIFFNIGVSSGAVNFTVRLGWPQLEQGAFATSPIPTTSAAVTRAADIVTLTSPPAFGSGFSALCSFTPEAPTTYATNQIGLTISDGTTSNRGFIFRAPSTGQGTISTGGTIGPLSASAWNGVASSNPVIVANTLAKGAASWTSASGMTTLNIGTNSVNTAQVDGSISRVALWTTTALTGAQLQQITT